MTNPASFPTPTSPATRRLPSRVKNFRRFMAAHQSQVSNGGLPGDVVYAVPNNAATDGAAGGLLRSLMPLKSQAKYV